MNSIELSICQINLVVADVARSSAFYRTLGFPVAPAASPQWAPHHAAAVLANNQRFELDSETFASQWNPGFKQGRGSCVIFVGVASRDMVDELFETLHSDGHRVQKQPEDAFGGARYAIVEDPDGNAVGIMSPLEERRRFAPPAPPQE